MVVYMQVTLPGITTRKSRWSASAAQPERSRDNIRHLALQRQIESAVFREGCQHVIQKTDACREHGWVTTSGTGGLEDRLVVAVAAESSSKYLSRPKTLLYHRG